MNNTFNQTKSEKTYAGMTYEQNLSESISKQLKRHNPNLMIASRPPVKVGNLYTDMKHKLSDDQQSCVIYSIPCKRCGKLYVGETVRNLCDRCREHERDEQKALEQRRKLQNSNPIKQPYHHMLKIPDMNLISSLRKF